MDNNGIVIGGDFGSIGYLGRNGLAKVANGGIFDETYNGTSGSGIDSLYEYADKVVVQPDGKAVVTVDFGLVERASSYRGSDVYGGIFRVNANGSIDSTWNSQSINTEYPDDGARVSDVAIASDGKFIAVIKTFDGVHRIHRLTSDGAIDETFTAVSIGTVSVPDVARVFIQSDGKILLVKNSSIVRYNSDGTADGTWTAATFANRNYSTLAFQSSGKIILGLAVPFSATNTTTTIVHRLNTDGSLDGSFSGATVPVGPSIPNRSINSIDIQDDDKVVVGGEFASLYGTTVNNVCRLSVDGGIDVGWDTTGTPGMDTGGFYEYFESPPFVEKVVALSTGKILASGFFATFRGTTVNGIVAINSDGTRDTAWSVSTPVGLRRNFSEPALLATTTKVWAGSATSSAFVTGRFRIYRGTSVDSIVKITTSSGVISTDWNISGKSSLGVEGTINAIGHQSDGKTIVAGYFWSAGGAPRKSIARFNVDGTHDSTFTDPQLSYENLTYEYSDNATVMNLIVLDDDKILISGNFTSAGETEIQFGVARLSADGVLDTSFEVNDIAIEVGESPDYVVMARQPDGKIVAASYINGVYRFNSDGSTDETWDSSTLAYPDQSSFSELIVLPSGKVLVAGAFTSDGIGSSSSVNIVRLNSDGTLDNTFEVERENIVPYTPLAMDVQSDGKIYVGGAESGSLIRLNSDGSLDSTWSASYNNEDFVHPLYYSGYIQQITVDADEKIVVAGRFTLYRSQPSSYIVRLNNDGTIDETWDAEGIPSTSFSGDEIIAFEYAPPVPFEPRDFEGYRYFATDLLSGQLLAEIPFYSVTYERAVLGAGAFTGSIPVIPATRHLDLYNSTMPGRVALYIVRGTQCVWGGIVWSRNYDVVTNTLNVTGSEFTSYLYRRAAWNTIQNRLDATVDPVGSPTATQVDIELVEGTFDFQVGETVYIDYRSSDMDKYNGYYTIQASPEPTTTTARAEKPATVDPIDVDVVDVTHARATNDVVTLTLTGTDQPFSEGEGVRVKNSGSNYNGVYEITDVGISRTEDVTHCERGLGVAKLYCRDGCEFEAGSIVTVTGVGSGFNAVDVTVIDADGNWFTYTNAGSDVPKTAVSPTGSAVCRPTISYIKEDLGTVAQTTTPEDATVRLVYTDAFISVRTDTLRFVRDMLDLLKIDYSSIEFANEAIEPAIERRISVSSLSRTDDVTTVTSASAHKLVLGQKFEVANADSSFVGTFTVKDIPTATTFTFDNTGANTSEVAATVTRDVVAREMITKEEKDATGVKRKVRYGRLTTSVPHGFTVGQKITVEDVDARSWRTRFFNTRINPDRRVTITAVTSTTLTYKLRTKKALPNYEFSVVRKKRYNNIATIRTTRAHRLRVGDTVTVSGVGSGFNGQNLVVTAIPNSRSFRYSNSGADVDPIASPGKVTLGKRATTRGTVTRTVDVKADSYGPFPLQSDIHLNVSPATGFSGTNKFPVDVIRGYELISVGELLDKYVSDLDALEYRIDCEYNQETMAFSRTLVLREVEFPDPPAPGEVSPVSRFGADALVFEYPGNISSFTVNETAESSATRVFMTGDNPAVGDGGSQPYAAAADDELLNDGWPILDVVQKSFSGAYDERTLYSEARKLLKQLRAPVGDFSITVSGTVPPYVGTYNPGDWCAVVADDEFILQRLQNDLEPRDNVLVRKIYSYSVSLPTGQAESETVQLRLIPEWEVDKLGE